MIFFKHKEKRKNCIFIILIVVLFFVIGLFRSQDSLYRDDYYEAVNREVLSNNPLKDGDYTWSMFADMQDKADNEMNSLFFDILEKNSFEEWIPQFQKIGIVYENAMDVEKRNLEGVGILSNYLQKVSDISSVEDIISVIVSIEKELGIPILTNMVIDYDYENINLNMVYLYPVTLPFGTSVDYYVDDDYMTYKAYLKRGMIQLLEVYGFSKDEARRDVSSLISFYEDIGRSSKSMLELSEVGSYFNKVSILELQNVYTKFSVSDYLDNFGIRNVVSYSLVDRGQYEKLNMYLDDSYLDLWKSHFLMMILSYYASYLSEDYEQVVLDLNNAITGESDDISKEDRTKDLVISLFSNELDVLYEKRLIDLGHREYLYGIFNDIKDVYREMLKENDWLSEETIRLAIDKLDNMRIYVGFDSFETNFSFLDHVKVLSKSEGGNLLMNVLEIMKLRRKNDLDRLESHKSIKAIGEGVVNAYYSPIKNAVYIPSAAVFMMDLDKSYYENLGRIGMVIAHEVTHGFDWNGSQFDKFGNFKNWWLDSDRESFSLLRQKVIDYYNSYEVLNGRFINGELTVNENIADLGALRCISLVAQNKGATDDEKKLMYSSFASFWVSQSSEEYMKLLLLQDTHAPNKYRVNAVLSSLDDFYELYDISFWNDMYMKKNDRVLVW